jgi:integrase/recombinase XerD
MKHLTLKTTHYQTHIESFGDWLRTLGYAKVTVYSYPLQLREFLYWLENKGITEEQDIRVEQISNYIEQFRNRKNQRRAGGLSTSYVNKQIDAINKLFKYLHHTGKVESSIKVNYLKEETRPERTILTIDEVKQLYSASDSSPIGQRDRAMLSVYYGCGLRKSEGLELEVSDILFERKLIYVRNAKNNYERYVPMNEAIIKDLEGYIYESRPLLLGEESKESALLISERGKKMCPETIVFRLHVLKQRTGNPAIQQKSFGLHSLRHSIATHLMQRGLDIEQIAQFLGHRTLDSTQIYTHIINEV